MKKSKSIFLVLLFIALTINSVQAQLVFVSTLAGSGAEGSADDTGTAASFHYQKGVAVDASGNVYVADAGNNKIRMITPAGVVSTLAGSGTASFADGTGAAASFNAPYGIAVDASGNVYVADAGNNKIRKITPAGLVSTLAGSGSAGSGHDGAGAVASFNAPSGVAVDDSGNVYVSDYGNNKIRKITPAGLVSTLAGSGTYGSADGIGAAASFGYPSGVAVDVSGNVYVADYGNNKIRKITPGGSVSTVAGSGSAGSADGTVTAASFYVPNGVAVDGSGNVYVADIYNNKIRKITLAGVVSTLAGTGTAGFADDYGALAKLYFPIGVAVDASGNVYVGDYGNHRIRKITPTPEIKISQVGTELISGSASSDFGTVNTLSTNSVGTFTIENLAPAAKALSLLGTPIVALSGANAADFLVNISNTTSSIAVGSSTTFTITFSPLSDGFKSATVTILNDDVGKGTYTFTITGTGIKMNQKISGLADISKPYGTTFDLPETASSSLALNYSSSNTNVATITGNTVTTTGVGKTVIVASQAGDDAYNAATDFVFVLTVSVSTAIENGTEIVGLSVFPNPTLGELTIMAPIKLQITIYNAQGIKLLEQSIPEGNTTLSLENFKAGLYILHYTDGSNISQQYRIVKN